MLVPAIVASFFKGLRPRLATQQKKRSTAKVTSCTPMVGNVSYVSALRKAAQLRAFRPPEDLLAMYVMWQAQYVQPA